VSVSDGKGKGKRIGRERSTIVIETAGRLRRTLLGKVRLKQGERAVGFRRSWIGNRNRNGGKEKNVVTKSEVGTYC